MKEGRRAKNEDVRTEVATLRLALELAFTAYRGRARQAFLDLRGNFDRESFKKAVEGLPRKDRRAAKPEGAPTPTTPA